MILKSNPIFTTVEGGFHEIQFIEDSLLAEAEDGQSRSLLVDARGYKLFYTGLLPMVEGYLQKIQYEYEVVEERPPHTPPTTVVTDDILPGITLRDYQVSAIDKCILRKRGIVDIATGGGKTEVMAGITKLLDLPTLIVTTGIKPMYQTQARLEKYGIKSGMYWAEDKDLNHKVVVGVSDSLCTSIKRRDPDFMDFVKQCKVLLMDEVHHLQSFEWTVIAEHIPAEYRFGFSGSPFSSHNEELKFSDYLLIGLTGDVIVRVPAWVLIERGHLARPIVSMLTIPYPQLRETTNNWHYIYRTGVVQNAFRNSVATSIAKQLVAQDHKVLVLVVQHEHGKTLLKMLDDPTIKFSYGGGRVSRWENGHLEEYSESTDETLKDLLEMGPGIFIGSTVYDEVIDIPDVSALIVLSAQKRYRRVVQRIGRALRPKLGTNEVLIVDFYDTSHYVLRNQSRRRIDVYNHDDYRYEVHFGLEAINSRLKTPLVFDVDPYVTLRKDEPDVQESVGSYRSDSKYRKL